MINHVTYIPMCGYSAVHFFEEENTMATCVYSTLMISEHVAIFQSVDLRQ